MVVNKLNNPRYLISNSLQLPAALSGGYFRVNFFLKRRRKMRNIKNENGRSMIEMLGVLAIIGVLSVGGIAGYSKAMNKYRINKTIEQITLIAGNVRAFFAPQRSYYGLENTVARKAKLVPDEMWNTNGSAFSNVFGRSVSIGAVNKADLNMSGDKQAFSIHYALQNDAEICIELLSQDWTILGKNVIGVEDYGCSGNCQQTLKYFTPPISVEDAVDVCSRSSGMGGIRFYIDVDPSSTYWQSKLNPS